jgi:Fe2+ transport system protein FeoA
MRSLGRAPFDGPVTVRLEDGAEQVLGERLAARIFVTTEAA